MTVAEDFPPIRHVGRDLGISYRLPGPARIELTIPVVPEVLRPDDTVAAEVVATIVDEAVGFLAVLAAQPDWGSTAALSIGFTNRPVAPTGQLLVEGRVRKAGRRLVFVTGRVTWGEVLIAHVDGEFAKVGRADRNTEMEIPPPDPDQIIEMALPGSGLTSPYVEGLGVTTLDPDAGRLRLEFGPYTRNSSGILHGGVVAALGVRAAELAAGAAAEHLAIQCLSAGRVGPFETTAEPMEGHPGPVWCTTTVDTADDRLMTAAVVRLAG